MARYGQTGTKIEPGGGVLLVATGFSKSKHLPGTGPRFLRSHAKGPPQCSRLLLQARR